MNNAPFQLSTRQKLSGENHHLWNNNGTWWFHGTRVLSDGSRRRVRCTLKTQNLTNARKRRDKILVLGSCGQPLAAAAQ